MLCFLFEISISVLCYGNFNTYFNCPGGSTFIDETNVSIWREFVEFGEITIFLTSNLTGSEKGDVYFDVSENVSDINKIFVRGNENEQVNFRNNDSLLSPSIHLRNVVANFSANSISCRKISLISSKLINSDFLFNCSSMEIDESCFSWIFAEKLMVNNLEVIIPDELYADFSFPCLPSVNSYFYKTVKTNYTLSYYHNRIDFECNSNKHKLCINNIEKPFLYVENSGDRSFLTFYCFVNVGISTLSRLTITLSTRSFLIIPFDISSMAGGPNVDTANGGNVIQDCNQMHLNFDRGSGRHTLSLLLGDEATKAGIIPLVQEDKTVISQLNPKKQEFYPILLFGDEQGTLRAEGKDLRLFLKGGLHERNPTAINGNSEISFQGFELSGSKLIVPNARISGSDDITFKFTGNKSPTLEVTGNITNDTEQTINIYMDDNYQKNETTDIICAENLICNHWKILGNNNFSDYIINGEYNYTKNCKYMDNCNCIQLRPTLLEFPRYRNLCHSENETRCPPGTKHYKSNEELNTFLPNSGKTKIYFQTGSHSLDIKSKLDIELTLSCDGYDEVQITKETFENVKSIIVDKCKIHSIFEETDDIKGNSITTNTMIENEILKHVKFSSFSSNYDSLETTNVLSSDEIFINFDDPLDYCYIIYDTNHLLLNTSNNEKEIAMDALKEIYVKFNDIKQIDFKQVFSENIEKFSAFAASEEVLFNISSLKINSIIELENNGSSFIVIDKNYTNLHFPLNNTKIEVVEGSLLIQNLNLQNDCSIEIVSEDTTIINNVHIGNNVEIRGPKIHTINATIQSFSNTNVTFETDYLRLLPSSSASLSYLPKTLEIDFNFQSIPYIEIININRNVNVILNYIDDIYEPVVEKNVCYFSEPIPFICGNNINFDNWKYITASSRQEFNSSTSIIDILQKSKHNRNCLCIVERLPPSTPTPIPTLKPTKPATQSPSKSPDPSPSPTFTPPSQTPTPTSVPWINSTVGIIVITATSASSVLLVIAGYVIYLKSKRSDLLVTIANESLISQKNDVFE